MGEQFDATRPIYAQIAERMTGRILSGEYPPGAHLESVRELAAAAGSTPYHAAGVGLYGIRGAAAHRAHSGAVHHRRCRFAGAAAPPLRTQDRQRIPG